VGDLDAAIAWAKRTLRYSPGTMRHEHMQTLIAAAEILAAMYAQLARSTDPQYHNRPELPGD